MLTMLLLAWLRGDSGRDRARARGGTQRTILAARYIESQNRLFLSQLSLHVALWERQRRLRTEAS